MQAGKRFTLWQTINWQKKYIFRFLIWSLLPVTLYYFFEWDALSIPWQPISLIGIAVAFYTGFKNNSSYERLWEGRKIWGGIVNTSRSFTVMIRDFVSNDEALDPRSEEALFEMRKAFVHRHVAWLYALTIQLRKQKAWEHDTKQDMHFRELAGVKFHESQFEQLKPYLDPEAYSYVMQKGNKASHLLSLQSKHLMKLRREGIIEHFRHLELQNMITEMYTLQGKAERIKNFPFPRQYATVTFFFIVLFILLLPFGMIDLFSSLGSKEWIWAAIPFSVVASWVFWMMERIGDYSENPFEGLYNDVPITSMARGIEIDIRQMLDETNLPEPLQPVGEMDIML
ncbi:MAG: bestrophin family ion channel [Bacteroidota bacterium]